MSELNFNLDQESDTTSNETAQDFSTEGLMEYLDVMNQTMAQSQQIYGQAIENLEKRLHVLESEYSKLVILLDVKKLFVSSKKPEGSSDKPST